jgi:endonuclease VIII
MSEGPEVKQTADKIAEAILGKSVVDLRGKTVERDLKEKIVGSNVLSVDTYGKNIIIHFSSSYISAQSYDAVGKMEDLQTSRVR